MTRGTNLFIDMCSTSGFLGTSRAQFTCASRRTYCVLPHNAYRVRTPLGFPIIAQPMPKRNATLMSPVSSIELAIGASPDVSECICLCSLTHDILQAKGRPLAQALHILRQSLPPQAVLVGQGILHDVDWLNLKEGTNFQVHRNFSLLACEQWMLWDSKPHCCLPDTVDTTNAVNSNRY